MLVKDPQAVNPYLRQGFKNRGEYLRQVAEDYGVPIRTVRTIADMLGPEEDFDGLLVSLPDTL
jgi:hypothetical protein